MSANDPVHGWSRYTHFGCRCDICVGASRAYRESRRLLGDRPSNALGIPEWMDHAACLGKPTELFFGPDKIGTGAPKGKHWSPEPARIICATCPVRGQCEEFANAEGIRHGIWGGLTVRERLERGRITRPPRARKVFTHGTTSGYARGCRCPDCRQANTLYNAQKREERRLARRDIA